MKYYKIKFLKACYRERAKARDMLEYKYWDRMLRKVKKL